MDEWGYIELKELSRRVSWEGKSGSPLLFTR